MAKVFSLAEWDYCDEHETSFPKGDDCPACLKEADPAPYCSHCGAKFRIHCFCPPHPEND